MDAERLTVIGTLVGLAGELAARIIAAGSMSDEDLVDIRRVNEILDRKVMRSRKMINDAEAGVRDLGPR